MTTKEVLQYYLQQENEKGEEIVFDMNQIKKTIKQLEILKSSQTKIVLMKQLEKKYDEFIALNDRIIALLTILNMIGEE